MSQIRNEKTGMGEDLIEKELSGEIIGAAMTVLNELRPGLDEKLYENALVIELGRRGHKVDQQRAFPVHYKGQLIGTLVPDLLVDDRVIVDPKIASAFNESHIAQMTGYLSITGLQVALLLNFKYARLSWKRVVRSHFQSALSAPSAVNDPDVVLSELAVMNGAGNS